MRDKQADQWYGPAMDKATKKFYDEQVLELGNTSTDGGRQRCHGSASTRRTERQQTVLDACKDLKTIVEEKCDLSEPYQFIKFVCIHEAEACSAIKDYVNEYIKEKIHGLKDMKEMQQVLDQIEFEDKDPINTFDTKMAYMK